MHQPETHTFTLGQGAPLDGPVAERLAGAFGARLEQSSEGEWQAFDTPDRRLQIAGLCLVRRDERLDLLSTCALGQGQPLATWRRKAPPPFVNTWPEGRLRRLLAPVCGIRALIDQGTVSIRRWSGHVRDERDKAVVRLDCERLEAGDEAVPVVRIQGLRGYNQALSEALSKASSQGLRACDEDPLATALARLPGTIPWPANLEPLADPDQPALAALRQRGLETLACLESLTPGILADVDSEFLHQYRVLLRAWRSLLGLLRQALAPPAVGELKDLLGTMARAGNRLRDLDVYLLARSRLIASVPPALVGGVESLLDRFARERKRVHRSFCRHLVSDQQRANLARVADLLSQSAEELAGPEAATAVGALGRAATWRAYRAVRKHGRRLTSETPDTAVHDLRLRCKKLRYLLDSFAHLAAPSQADALRALPRRLQNRLGAFNDAVVQQEFLLATARTVRGIATEEALAVGALCAHLHGEQSRARCRVARAFAAFDHPDSRRAFRAAFASDQEPGR